MIFFTFEFLFFFAFVLAFNWFLKPWPRLWRIFLLAASYYFYSVWDWRLLAALAGLSVFNYLVGLAIKSDAAGEKKFFLALGIIGNLEVLVFFKYYDFFRFAAEKFLNRVGIESYLPVMELIMSVGISFFLFKMISFLVDCYRGKIEHYPSLLNASLYFAFFPQLLSGPIQRAGDFLPQLAGGGARQIADIRYSVTLLMAGIFKKLLIVNYLTVNIIDDVFMVPQNHGSIVALLAVLAYALVIYFDLSSYSDMSIGFSGLLGFKSPANFDSPYAALSISDFWRRWHITLSDWIRDYIYIPLGGNRKGKLRQSFNLVAAMTVMGFWHGASAHYLFWGFLQGTGLSIANFFNNRLAMNIFAKFFSWMATFVFVVVSWIFFRAESINDGFAMIGRIFSFERLDESFKLYVLAAIVIGFILLAFEKKVFAGAVKAQQKLPIGIWFVAAAIALMVLFRAGSDTLPSFIYFSF